MAMDQSQESLLHQLCFYEPLPIVTKLVETSMNTINQIAVKHPLHSIEYLRVGKFCLLEAINAPEDALTVNLIEAPLEKVFYFVKFERRGG